MPGQLIHLAVAREIAVKMYVDYAQFYLGTLAPDSIHAFSNAPKHRKVASHLWVRDAEIHESDNTENRRNVQTFLEQKYKTGDNIAFYLGYAVHVLADFCWAENIYRRFLSHNYIRTLSPQECVKLYYHDLEKLQFDMFRECNWVSEMWDFLKSAQAVDCSPLVSEKEIEHWKERTLHWFDAYENIYNESPKYICKPYIDEYITKASDEISNFLSTSCAANKYNTKHNILI